MVFVVLRFPYSRAIESFLHEVSQGRSVHLAVKRVDVSPLYATAYLRDLRIEYEGVNIDIAEVRVKPRLTSLFSLKLEFTVMANSIKVGSAFIPVLYLSVGSAILKRQRDGWEIDDIHVIGKGLEARGKVYLYSMGHIRYELKVKPSGVFYGILERLLPVDASKGSWIEVKGKL